ncbi:trk system potassium uptake protein TrkH [Marinobacter antarcticus]|uniref:Trk system potassium uptake protein TrkH n=1 Tax=Marinobacter antarcticus TaxID=564117 RepID=A0A1M6TXG8_9GAMM|nr:potassium transporter TrkG [Marinobacter antarcticus]SHK61722.1 trk system potassium uptake protein TrkH [Marinobacter antarcticus]
MTIISSQLTYAVRMPVLAKYLGLLAFMLALLTLAPLGAAVIFQDYQIAIRYLGVIAVLLIFWGVSRSIAEPRQIQTNEALTIVALAFVFSPLLMTFPFMGSGLTFYNALFEAISAVTTTGLSVTTDLASKPQSFLFARSWMQWYGGLGIVVLSVAMMMGHQVSSRSLSEPLGAETLATTTRTHARQTLIIYCSLTVTGIVMVWLISGNGMMAVNHVLAAVSTGGFSSFDNSLADIDSWYSRFGIISLSLCGALPLPLYIIIFSKNWRTGIRDSELLALVIAIFVLSILLFISLHFNSGMGLEAAAGHSLFLGISAQTTAGFTTLDIDSIDNGAKLSMIVSMLIGGSVGSTAGGIKLLRFLILLRMIQVVVKRTTMPLQAVQYPRLGDKKLEETEVQRVLILILLFIGIIVISWFAFLMYGYAPMNALFEVVSASATVGLSTGITSVDMPVPLKLVLCLDMLFGRLEIIALLVVLYPPNWIGKRKGL